MRGYFGIGVFGISKPRNLGSLLRSTHAFGGSFFFTIHPAFDAREVKQSDTSDAAKHLPLYVYNSIDEMQLPRNCQLVGVELTDEAIELPSFHHPEAAAYLLGPERGSLTPEILERCDQTVKIPTKFCVNVGIAGPDVPSPAFPARRRKRSMSTAGRGCATWRRTGSRDLSGRGYCDAAARC